MITCRHENCKAEVFNGPTGDVPLEFCAHFVRWAGGRFFRSVCCPEGAQAKEGGSPVDQHGLVSCQRDESRPA